MFERVTALHPELDMLADPRSLGYSDNSERRALYLRFTRSAVRQLPPRQRVVVEMYFSVMPNGRPPLIADIAKILGISCSTVSRRLEAARRNLKVFASVCEQAGFFS